MTKPLSAYYGDLETDEKRTIRERFYRETRKSEKTFYNRLNKPNHGDYLIFARLLNLSVHTLMGYEPFLPPLEPLPPPQLSILISV